MTDRNDAGAATELFVAADLMRRGFEVYRALSPGAKVDLVYRDAAGQMVRVQVRSVHLRTDGTVSPCVRERDECDIYAFVHDETIVYMGREEAVADIKGPRLNSAWRLKAQEVG